MTNPTPRDSAQLPPLPALPEPGHRGPDGTGNYFSAFTCPQMRIYAMDYAREALRAQAASVEPFGQALDLRVSQGWQLGSNACPILYTDTINGRQVSRDDLWIATTAGLKGGPSPTTAPVEASEGEIEAAASATLSAMSATPTPAQAFEIGARWALMAGGSPQPRPVAASSPATAVDAVDDLTFLTQVHAQIRYLIDDLTTAVDDDGLTRYVTTYGGSLLYSNFIAALIPLAERLHAALQASRQPQTQAQQGGGEGEVGYLYGFDRSDLSAMADGLDCHEQTVDGLQTTTAAAAQFIRAALQACAGDDAKILEWLLPNIHPANFGLDYDKEHYENDVVGAWKKAILNDLATTKGRP